MGTGRSMPLWVCVSILALALSLPSIGCGSKTAVRVRPRGDGGATHDGGRDGGVGFDGGDGGRDAGLDAGDDGGLDASVDAGPDGCVPVDDGCRPAEVCNNGLDDDCNGTPDDGCTCTPGDAQGCFVGPPGRRGVGVCVDGTQTCLMTNLWGACEGGIGPQPDVCNGADNLCDGCSARFDCPIFCPSEGDPRVPDGSPFTDYPLRGRDFYMGPARSFRWTVQGGPCDRVSPLFTSFTLTGANTESATFTPLLSGDYTVRLRVITVEGTTLSCEWVVHVRGPGLRIEMCYPESTTQDLDLLVKQPGHMTPWYASVTGATTTAGDAVDDECGWHNCEATIRGLMSMRADWGYAPSPLSECEGGPHGAEWRTLGFCANPRLDVDNNLSEGTGLPENINVDAPRDGERFRIMVQNWTGMLARPLVNVYCSGRRVATYGAAPDEVPRFRGTAGSANVGAMWRVADVTTHLDAAGNLTCDAAQVHPSRMTSGYDVTYDNPRF